MTEILPLVFQSPDPVKERKALLKHLEKGHGMTSSTPDLLLRELQQIHRRLFGTTTICSLPFDTTPAPR